MLAIAGGKGGCGKTTTALGLASALARFGRRPLVVDADCDMPNLHTMAETDRCPGLGAVGDGMAVEHVVTRSGAYPGVDVVPAGTASGAVDAAVLRRLARRNQPVIVDCPAGASDAAAAPLRYADDALVVSTADRASLSDAVKTARMAESLDTRVLGTVLTRTTGQSPPWGTDERFRPLEPVLATVPPVSGGVLESEVGRASYERLADVVERRNL